MGNELGNPVNHVLNRPLIGQSALDVRIDEVSGQINALYRFNVFPNQLHQVFTGMISHLGQGKRALMVFAGIADGEIVSVKNTRGFSDVLQVFQSQRFCDRHNCFTFHESNVSS